PSAGDAAGICSLWCFAWHRCFECDPRRNPFMIPNQEQVFSALRTLLAYAAGIAVAHGWITENTSTQLVGVIVVLAPLVWGMVAQTAANKVKAAGTVQGAKVMVDSTADASVKAVALDPAVPNVSSALW